MIAPAKLLLGLIYISLLPPSLHSAADVTYTGYAEVLTAYVDAAGRVDYQALQTGRAPLDAFVDSLGLVAEARYQAWSDQDKIAFWLNAYNALTLTAIIDNYPIKSSRWKSMRFPKNSIRQIGGVWDKLSFTVLGKPITLEGIEHGILRKHFDEPRIHMAMVCAAKGCPKLRPEPYRGDQLEAQLASQSLEFMIDPLKLRFDHKKKVLYLSPIFKWFGDDFVPRYGESKERAIVAFVLKNGGEPDEGLAELVLKKRYALKHLDYDWSLNEK
jgi:hypothetical protein